MDEAEKNQVVHRKSSSISRKTVESTNRSKPASIYEINELYSALQDLVHSSPSVEHRRLRGTISNLDSSDGTSGTDSPDIRNRFTKRNTRVIRSSSSIITRYPSSTGQATERQPKISTPEFKYKKLSNQRPPIGFEKQSSTSPKVTLKKSKSDAPRTRSKSSIDNAKSSSIAHKIREERLKFTDGLKRREKKNNEACIIEGVAVKGIDDLLDLAKWSPKQHGRKKKKGPRKRVSSFLNSEKRIKQNFSDSNLRSMEISSRLNEWYEKASSQALQAHGDDNYESSSGSESDDESNDDVERKEDEYLEDSDLKCNVLNPDEVMKKWMGQKKKCLAKEERGRSSSDTSYEAQSTDEMSQSNSSISKIDSSQDNHDHYHDQNQQTSIIISQASIDNANDDLNASELPNQPIFYIPNLSPEGKKKLSPTIIHKEKAKKDNNINNNSLLTPARPRSRSAIASGDSFQKEDNEDASLLKSGRKSRSLGLYRRGSVETTGKQSHKDMKERLLRTTSEYKTPRPRSLNLSPDINYEKRNEQREEQKFTADGLSSYITVKNIQKNDKPRKLSKFPGKLKSLLTGKKS